MKVTWELDTESPVDLHLIMAMNNLIRVKAAPEPGEKQPVVTKANAPADDVRAVKKELKKEVGALVEEVKEFVEEEEAPKPEPKKRQPKVKNQEQLDKLSLEEMVTYLKARKEHSMLDARFLAKHYQGRFGEHEALLTVLHDLGANNFEDLKDPSHFIKNAIPMIEGKLASGTDKDETDFLGV